MSKKKNKKKNAGPPKPLIRLSQCMIVKNEEKNIEKALNWAKHIAFEQIVVDTGSTDRTVEIAEKMGANVYHFKWINDFAAAKNYAMDQAMGNWIAILDADEYMPPEDTEELMTLLKKVQSDPKLYKQYDSICCSWLQLDDEGKVYSVLTQNRFFKNRPDLRYKGKIHEAVMLQNKSLAADNLKIMHTGYAHTVYGAADKRERNIKLLREEYERDPTDPHIMIYLADTIKADGTEESRAEAERLYLAGLAAKKPADPAIKRIAYDFLIPRFVIVDSKKEETKRLCTEAITELPNIIDYYYYRALLNNNSGNYKEAMKDLYRCEQIFTNTEAIPETRILLSNPLLLYYQLSVAAEGLGDEENAKKYSEVVATMLMEGKDQAKVLGPYMVVLFLQGMTGLQVFEKLAPVYDVNKPKDLLMIANTAKDYGILMFAKMIMEFAGDMLKQ